MNVCPCLICQDKFFASCYRNFPNPAPPQTLSFPYGYHCTYVTQNHALHFVHIQSEAQIRVNYCQLQDGFFAREKPVLILKLRHACTRTIHQLKPDSWTCNFVEVCGHNLLRLEVLVYNVYITNQIQTTFAEEGGAGGVKSERRLWVGRRKTLKTFVPITSKNLASVIVSKCAVSYFEVKHGKRLDILCIIAKSFLNLTNRRIHLRIFLSRYYIVKGINWKRLNRSRTSVFCLEV
jgi:hypothetical protein